MPFLPWVADLDAERNHFNHVRNSGSILKEQYCTCPARCGHFGQTWLMFFLSFLLRFANQHIFSITLIRPPSEHTLLEVRKSELYIKRRDLPTYQGIEAGCLASMKCSLFTLHQSHSVQRLKPFQLEKTRSGSSSASSAVQSRCFHTMCPLL